MPEVTQDKPGSFCWAELATTDPSPAKNFYQNLFGWEANDAPMDEGNVYSMMQANCDSSVGKATSAGASVLVPPMDIPKVGGFSVLRDPQGAVFNLFTPNS